MENTPLQLYKKAYELHYTKKKLKKAGHIYKELLSNFPDSEVSKYASIQLSKIITNNIDEDMPKNKATIGFILLISFLVINTVALGGTLFWLYSHIQFSKSQNFIAMKTAQSISNIYAGNEEAALNILRELKYHTKDDITPYEISANIFLKQNQFKKARNEYESYKILYPDNIISTTKIDLINKEEIKFKDNLDFVKKAAESQPKIVKVNSPKPVKNKPVKKKIKNENELEIEPPVIDKDDVSYF
jgi:flagellar basal body-associated protein FliL